MILLHGWPYDIHSYIDVVPMLTRAGYRVLVPYLRGYGSTHFRDPDAVRNGEPAALASDVVAFMDALKVDKAILAGYDWGARTADIVAALWPERVKGLVSVSGYLIGSQEAGKQPLPPKAEMQWWYQFYFATERGREGYARHTHDFARLIWQTASPHSRSSPFPPSRLKAMQTVPHIRTRAPTRRNSRANTSIETSPAASGTTCRRKLRRPLPRPLSTSPGFE